MSEKLTPELKELKQEFDFIHKKIGDLEWELATIYLGKVAVTDDKVAMLHEQIDNYTANMNILIEKIHQEVRDENKKNGICVKPARK